MSEKKTKPAVAMKTPVKKPAIKNDQEVVKKPAVKNDRSSGIADSGTKGVKKPVVTKEVKKPTEPPKENVEKPAPTGKQTLSKPATDEPVEKTATEVVEIKPSKPTYSLEVKTMQMNVIKILIESLKEVINDATFIFDKDGIHMKAIDGPESIYVNMNLRAGGFELFHLRGGKTTTIAIGIVRLFKLIGRSITSNDVISLFLDDNDRGHLGVEMANFSRKSTDDFKVKLIELNNIDIQFEQDYQYDTVFSLPASYFHKLCRDMNYVSKTVTITCVGEQVMFSCKSAIGSRDSPIDPTKDYLKFIKNNKPDEIKLNSFCLSDLISFTKFTNLSTNSRVKVHLQNDAPLMLEYTVGDLGTISIYIGAVKAEEVKTT